MNKLLIILCLITFSENINIEWTKEASGYSQNSGYAGIFGKAITCIRISGNQEYKIRLLNGGWLSPVTGNNIYDNENGFSGIEGRTIDGVAISGAKYRVHILGEGWLDEVSEYNTNNPNCGISGKEIDAIMVKGRIYSVAYILSYTNVINYGNGEVSQSTIINCAKNQIGKTFLKGEAGPDYFDDSGLAYYCHGGKIPRDIEEQYNGGTYIVNPEPGDLLFWRSQNEKERLHVSICLYSGMMIHAPNSNEIIQYTNYLEGEVWPTLYIGARRYWN